MNKVTFKHEWWWFQEKSTRALGFLPFVLIRSLVIIIIAMFLYQYFEGSFLSCAMIYMPILRLTVSQFSQLPLSKVWKTFGNSWEWTHDACSTSDCFNLKNMAPWPPTVMLSWRRPKWIWLVEFSELNAVFRNQEQTFIGTRINQELIKSKVIKLFTIRQSN